MAPTYHPEIFDQADLEAAKRIIVTPSQGRDTDDRWQRETPYLVELIGERLQLREGQLVVDYGCGVGRIAKALIERYGCRVLGVDISKEMRGHAPHYVDSSLFSVVSRGVLEALGRSGLRADAAVAVWVLQHCPRPPVDISLLAGCLRAGAGLAVVNSVYRSVPTVEKGWTSDGLDIDTELRKAFSGWETAELDPEAMGQDVASKSFFRTYRRP